MTGFELRKEQQRVIDQYHGGYAAISAVPGAGKTTTLSALAAHLIDGLEPRQRVMIVTYQNAAVSNFQRAVAKRLEERGKPERGFVVRTLHSLASEVLQSVRHRAELDAGARVLDEADAFRLLDEAIAIAKVRHQDTLRELVQHPDASGARRWPDDPWLLREVVKRAVREIKNLSDDLDTLRQRSDGYGLWLPFVLDACSGYQTALRERGYLEYDDLVIHAVQALENDPALCERLRKRWPYLLEDEAQDSSPLQEQMLTLIAGLGGNLVRVGDPNQAILTTFTNSSVEGFRRWLGDASVQQFELAGSSRSTETILRLANSFVQRVHLDFEIEAVRQHALREQPIHAIRTPIGLLENPPVPLRDSRGVEVAVFDRTEDECVAVVDMALRYLKKFPDRTAAILVGGKEVGYEYSAAIADSGFPDDKIIRLLSGKDGRPVGLIEKLVPILNYLEKPDNSFWLADSLANWSELKENDRVVMAVRGVRPGTGSTLGDVLYPEGNQPVGSCLRLPHDLNAEEQRTHARLRAVPGWLENRLAPPHELLALIAATIQPDDSERPLLDAIIVTVGGVPPDPTVSRLQQLRSLLKEIKERHRRLRGTHDEYEIKIEPGTLTISTRHQAKGLEWDIVFAVGCDEFWFHGTLDFPRRTQQAFLGPFDPVLTMMTELRFALEGNPDYPSDADIEHTTVQQATDEVSEGLRIMYVTMTRARTGLWLSWHREGRQGDRRVRRNESPVFPMVCELVEEARMEAVFVAAD